MPIEYDTFPLKKFFRIREDESLLKEYGIDTKEWESLKEQWSEKHPTADTERLVEANRKVILEDMRFKSYVLLGRLLTEIENCEPYYKALGIKHHGTLEQRMSYIQGQLHKAEKRLKKFIYQRDSLIEAIKKKSLDEESFKTDLNEVLASFEIAGISIGDYETMTLGRYDGLNSAFEKKAEREKNGRRN